MANLNTFSVQQLSCRRGLKSLFAQLSFQLTAGELLLIEGTNGSGKSSLLSLLAGLASPMNGTICWQGRCIQTQKEAYREHMHFIGHTNGIKLGLTVRENLLLQAKLQAILLPDITPILQGLQLTEHRLASELSAGQKRKLALAKLFLFPKPLWLLDEPLTALDQRTQHYFLQALQQHLQTGGMAIISSHQNNYPPPFKTLTLIPC